MEYSGHDNRRQHPRVREDLKVNITDLDSPDKELLTSLPIECYTKDISFQGICIICHVRLQPRLKLALQIESASASFSFSGLVIWCNYNSTLQEYEIGIQLLEPDNISVEWKKLVIDLIVKYRD